MIAVRIKALSKTFGGKARVVALDHLDLAIEEGELLVLLGPSGCGKTTALRCVAGLETPDTGSISLGRDLVFDTGKRIDLPPERRGIGMVFQSYALWPHMTVRRNIGYPLRARRMRAQLRQEQWVEKAAALVECEHLLDRYPNQLSGGQQQRVALARGLVAQPAVMLLDEPLSNLDARLRDTVRSELHDLHRRLRFTGIYVTHDQAEGFALGDRLAVMRSGVIEQMGTPEAVYSGPATAYVADFLGITNCITLYREDGAWTSPDGLLGGALPAFRDEAKEVNVRVRPEDIGLLSATAEPAVGVGYLRHARIVDSSYGGRHVDVMIETGNSKIRARIPHGSASAAKSNLLPGTEVTLTWASDTALIYDGAGNLMNSPTPRSMKASPTTTGDAVSATN